MRILSQVAVLMVAVVADGWAQGPEIHSIVGAADYSSAATIGIPQGSIFAVMGVGLADSTVLVDSPKLQVEISGVRIDIRTIGDTGKVTQAPLLYISPTQINAIMPSSVSPGQYEVEIVTGTSGQTVVDATPIVVT